MPDDRSPALNTTGGRAPSDEELDAYIRTRLALIGIDLSVLPEEDPDAPADQAGVHRSIRNFLRNTVPALSAYELDPQAWPPVLYPAALPPVGEERVGER
ncbi:MAG: hypothetical protein EA351_09165 [Gemmatimonadales bacterium]|nr:MAG: hypothetical protein EA351_09165 [Gemmatimonadales bacterium]